MNTEHRTQNTEHRTQNTESLIDIGFSADALAERKAELLKLLGQAAPDLLSDNQLNLDKLKALLAGDIADAQEHYELNWAGKSEARREIQKTTSSTLLPSPNNPAQAQHMLIEGENLEVLRVLQKSYYGKVKMIYIDPPYNTGNDSFVYPDDYSETLDEYLKRTGEKNEDGYLNKQSLWKKNSKESGQYHSAWLSMMYPRLYLARNLLRDDGVIFISIDDNEQANLKLLCDEVFGAENFVANIVWNNVTDNNPTNVAIEHEYICVYAKNKISINQVWKSSLSFSKDVLLQKERDLLKRHDKLEELQEEYTNWFRENKNQLWPLENYKFIDFSGIYSGERGVHNPGKEGYRYNIIHPVTQKPCKQPLMGYRFPQSTMDKMIEEGRIIFGETEDKLVEIKVYARDYLQKLSSVFKLDGRAGTNEVKALFPEMKRAFTNPKTIKLIEDLISFVCDSASNDIILDFFAGSGTTAHAVMELNAEDGGNRQSISVQMPELLDEKSEAYKAGYRTIADITRARIEKVIAKLKTEKSEQTQGLACAHFKLAPSNFKVWRSDLVDVDAVRSQLEIFQQAEKSTTAQCNHHQAMLTELLLKNKLGALGVHAISKSKTLASGMTVHRVLMSDDRTLWLCFDAYQQGFKDEIIKANPAQVIMLNSCFNSVGEKADEHISNLQLELGHHGIGLSII